MKSLKPFDTILVLLVSVLLFISCESDKSKIEKSYKQWVYENVANPDALKEIISIEIEDTIPLYSNYDWVYTSFYNEKKTYSEIVEKIKNYDIEDVDVSYWFYSGRMEELRNLKKEFINYQKACENVIDDSTCEEIAIKAHSAYEGNKSKIVITYLAKTRIFTEGDYELDNKMLYYYPQNNKSYEKFDYVFNDLSKAEKDLNYSVQSLRSRLSNIYGPRYVVLDLFKKLDQSSE